jgi:hypothetical protein
MDIRKLAIIKGKNLRSKQVPKNKSYISKKNTINKDKITCNIKLEKNIKLKENKKSIKENKKDIKEKRVNKRGYKENKLEYKDDKILIDFMNTYDVTSDIIFNNPKIEFRYICYKYIDLIRNYKLPPLKKKKSDYEAVLIEFRLFPHIEFIIRNNILKLGNEWIYTIICGNLNYEYMKNMVANINNNIKVIKIDYDNLTPSQYSLLLSSKSFWDLLTGEKILIYQEDSIIFKNNINDFLEFDYIGAPWNKSSNDTPNSVGNGGLSLRTKSSMINVIETVSIENSKINSSTQIYMKNTKSTTMPEDVYFSLNLQEYNLGKVADWDTAIKFSTESIKNDQAFGGHGFWIANQNWKNMIIQNCLTTLNSKVKNIECCHRGGWNNVLQILDKNNLYSNESLIDFYDVVEHNLDNLDSNFINKKKWIGIVHYTPNAPEYLANYRIKEKLLNQKTFINALPYCVGLITLSNYLKGYLDTYFLENNININTYYIKHPVDDNCPKFELDKYFNNNEKKILQIGQQLRKLTFIYSINLDNSKFKKIWLTGDKNINRSIDKLKKEIQNLNLNINITNVEMKYLENFQEYDSLLEKNIVILNLFDACANNTVVECIIRNTPIIINKLPGVVDYLGEDYPLYYSNEDEINNLLNDNKIIEAYQYLKNLNKEELTMNYFIKKFIFVIKNIYETK